MAVAPPGAVQCICMERCQDLLLVESIVVGLLPALIGLCSKVQSVLLVASCVIFVVRRVVVVVMVVSYLVLALWEDLRLVLVAVAALAALSYVELVVFAVRWLC